MEQIGSFALALALALAAYAVLASVIGARQGKPLLALSGARATIAVCALISVAAGILVTLLLGDHFEVAYVASHSNAALPLFYKVAALWGGQEGSLLFWSWLLSLYVMVAIVTMRREHRALAPYVVAILAATQFFFLLLNNFVAHPFDLLGVAQASGPPQVFRPADGRGLNPLLQYPAMTIHPPMLYLGFVGFSVPFAFGLASLITRAKGEKWIHTTRRWTMVTWGFLTAGIVLGGRWAYAVLGWGGYWGWDPVENASLMPWLTGTAFLHSVMMQEKKGMLKVWNMVLIFLTFFLCIFGTFLTRSGLVSSVHAFAQSAIGTYFAVFILIGVLFTGWVLLNCLDFLKSENQLESFVSRESSFLFNNLALLAACFAVLWGTIFPILSEAVQGEKITVGAPFFNKVNVPIGLFLLFLTGVGPLFAWRRTSLDSLRRNFLIPTTGAVAVACIAFAFGARKLYPVMTILLGTFVLGTIVQEFYKGARVIRQKSGDTWAAALVELTRRNTRRYGGYVIHLGIVLIFIGIAGAAFNVDREADMLPGDALQLRGYRLVCQRIVEDDNPNYSSAKAEMAVYQDGRLLTTLYPEKRFYKASQQPTSEVAIRPRMKEDLYVVFAGMADDGKHAVIHVYINPLVNWIWAGALITLVGTGIALLPNKLPERAAAPVAARARTQDEVPV